MQYDPMNTKTYLCICATLPMYVVIYSNNPRILEGPSCYQWLPLRSRRVGRSVSHGRDYVGRYLSILLLHLFVYFYNKLFLKKKKKQHECESYYYQKKGMSAMTLQNIAEPTQGGHFCFRHFNGWFSAHGNMALKGSAQIQGSPLIVSNSKGLASGPVRLCGAQWKSRAKGKSNHYPMYLRTSQIPELFISLRESQGRGRGRQGEVVHVQREPCSDQRFPFRLQLTDPQSHPSSLLLKWQPLQKHLFQSRGVVT